MRAMILNHPDDIDNSPLVDSEIDSPEPALGEFQLKVKACGVCHTDLHEIEGELAIPSLPIVPGHEIIGIIEDVNGDNSPLQKGDRVGVGWLHSSCGTCKYCKRYQENLCSTAQFTGLHVYGGYAEYTTVSFNFAYHIPETFSDVEAAPLMCAGVIGYRSLRLSDLNPGETLGLFGFGASAHIIIQIALYKGCEVFVFTRSTTHQQHALDLGGIMVGSSKDTPPHLVDRAISFTPDGNTVIDALNVLDKGGTLAINAIYSTDIPSIPWNTIYHERTIRSVANTTRQDAIDFLKIAEEIPIHTDTQVYSLSEANQALQDFLKASRINGAAVLKID